MAGLSKHGFSVLITLNGEPARMFGGDEILQRVFANSTLVPMEPREVCAAIRELENLGLARVVREGRVDPDYDFAVAQYRGPTGGGPAK